MMIRDNNIIQRIQAKLNHLKKKTDIYFIEDGLADKEIDIISARNNLLLPQELRQWLNLCNGISGTRKKSPIAFGEIFGMKEKNGVPSIFCEYYNHPFWASKGWIPVANDGCGNYIMLMPRTVDNLQEYRVAFFDAADSVNELFDTPSSISDCNFLCFMNYILLQEIMSRRYDSFNIYPLLY